MQFYTIMFDGGCGPKNPGGTATYGFILMHNGIELERGSGVIGSGPTMSNNLAEHYAVAEGMTAFLKHYKDAPNTILRIRGDSRMVINQLIGKWNGDKTKLYWPEYERSIALIKQIRRSHIRVMCEWVPRAQNQLCDDLTKAQQKHANLPK